jgi:hypothetical protein
MAVLTLSLDRDVAEGQIEGDVVGKSGAFHAAPRKKYAWPRGQ